MSLVKSKYKKIKKKINFCSDGYIILKSDGFNNMDHMRISDIKQSSVI